MPQERQRPPGMSPEKVYETGMQKTASKDSTSVLPELLKRLVGPISCLSHTAGAIQD